MRWLNGWWTWSTRPGKLRKIVGFGAPSLVALVLLGIVLPSEEPGGEQAGAHPTATRDLISASTSVASLPAPTTAAATLSPPVATPTPTAITHVVQPGDSLSAICQELLPTIPTDSCVTQAVQLNSLANASQIAAGQTIILSGQTSSAPPSSVATAESSAMQPTPVPTAIAPSPTQTAATATPVPPEAPQPTATLMPTATAAPQQSAATFNDGTHIVGSDIAPGTYESMSSGGCYWERLSGFDGSLGSVIANSFVGYTGPAIVTIESADVGFSASGCGTWTPLSAAGSPATTFSDGTYLVGSDVAAGTYRAQSAGSGCYWERLSGFDGTLDHVIANDFDSSGGQILVSILPSDVGFSTSGCGTWSP